MNCPGCQKEVTADRLFCTWCERYIPNPKIGTKAGFGRRLVATLLDGVLFWVVFLLVSGLFGGLFAAAGGTVAGVGGFVSGIFLAWVGYAIALLWFLSKGLTPGKLLVGEQVVEHLKGADPGLGRMLVREVFGKFVSGLFLGLGYFWAIWDKNGQAWHDKIAGTVIVNRSGSLAIQRAATTSDRTSGQGRFCTACGTRVSRDQRFCQNCGAGVG